MSLTCTGSHKAGLLHIAFNQDNSCIAIGTSEGIRIYHIDTHQICYRDDIGAVGVVEMLYCTSLLAYVGAGDQAFLTPRRLSVVNTSSGSRIRDLSFSQAVLSVRLNRQRLVAVLDGWAHIHALQTLAQLRILETPPNPKGLAALTPCSEPCFLALPASPASGVLRVYDLLVDGGHVVCEVLAHKSPLAAMAWNHNGTYLATASTTGTVIRVYAMPHAVKAFSFRRGTYPASIHCLAFSPEGYDPPLLAAASGHGSIHIFRLEAPQRSAAAAAASAAAGLLSAVMNYSAVSDMVEPQRNIATIRLPCQGLPAICALQHPSSSSNSSSYDGRGGAASSGMSELATLPEEEEQVSLVVASAAGLLYEYSIEELSSSGGPKCSLAGEWTLLGTSGQLVIAAGEARSANRTKWTQKDQQSVQQGPSSRTKEQYVASISHLTQADGAHDLVWTCATELQPLFGAIDARVAVNLARVQAAFKQNRIGPHHFQGSTGYGHGDLGREALDNVMAAIMGAEAALVRIQFMSGTHAIAAGLFAALRPGDEMLAVAGKPYDTMEEVIGTRGTPGHGSLMEWGISYRELPLNPDGGLDWEGLASAIKPGKTRVAHIQRSCGYALRPTLTVQEIGRAVQIIKAQDPSVLVLVDNCYGEFTEELEPTAVGADLVMGSLIKNAGGTLAPGGGYVAGRADLVSAVGARLAAPGIGTDAGGVPGTTLRLLFQGLFQGPHTTGEAIKGGRLVAAVMSRLGFRVIPGLEPCLPAPPSMITAVELGSREAMVAFCKGIQLACPVGSYITPEPGVTAGYGDEVIFADGTFIDGSTAELSADGPLRPPYVVYCQGGAHWTHWALALESAVRSMAAAGLLPQQQQQQQGEEQAPKGVPELALT